MPGSPSSAVVADQTGRREARMTSGTSVGHRNKAPGHQWDTKQLLRAPVDDVVKLPDSGTDHVPWAGLVARTVA